MSRLDHAPTEMHVEPGPLPAAHAITLQEGNIVRVVEQGHSAELNQLLIDVGTARMATASENFSAIVRISKDAAIKESKTYKSLKGQFSADGGKMNGTWEEYCGMTGRSVDTVDRGIANLKVFGVEALESMMRIGFTRSELNQYRRLPADERTALIEAAKAGDKDGLLDLAETLITRHTKEKEALETRAKEAEDTAAARDTIIQNKEARLNDLEEQNHKLKRRVETATPDEVVLEIRAEADLFAFRAEHAIGSDLRKAFEALTQQGGAHSEYMLGLITQIELAAAVLRADYGLLKAGPDGDPTPYWERGSQPAVN